MSEQTCNNSFRYIKTNRQGLYVYAHAGHLDGTNKGENTNIPTLKPKTIAERNLNINHIQHNQITNLYAVKGEKHKVEKTHQIPTIGIILESKTSNKVKH